MTTATDEMGDEDSKEILEAADRHQSESREPYPRWPTDGGREDPVHPFLKYLLHAEEVSKGLHMVNRVSIVVVRLYHGHLEPFRKRHSLDYFHEGDYSTPTETLDKGDFPFSICFNLPSISAWRSSIG